MLNLPPPLLMTKPEPCTCRRSLLTCAATAVDKSIRMQQWTPQSGETLAACDAQDSVDDMQVDEAVGDVGVQRL